MYSFVMLTVLYPTIFAEANSAKLTVAQYLLTAIELIIKPFVWSNGVKFKIGDHYDYNIKDR